jgi:hypothetical protein
LSRMPARALPVPTSTAQMKRSISRRSFALALPGNVGTVAA